MPVTLSPIETAAPDTMDPAPDTMEPISDTMEPAPDTEEPVPNTMEPAPDTMEPAPNTMEPAPDTMEPAPDTMEPVPNTMEPAPDTMEPAPDTMEPIPDTMEPAPNTMEPVPNTMEPVPDTMEPAPDTTEPAETPAPVPMTPSPENSEPGVCIVCPNDGETTNPDLPFEGMIIGNCGQVQEFGRMGIIPEDLCADTQESFPDMCGCEGDQNPTPSPFTPEPETPAPVVPETSAPVTPQTPAPVVPESQAPVELETGECIVCPDDDDVTNPLTPIQFQDLIDVNCQQVQDFGREGLLPIALCPTTQAAIPMLCGCGGEAETSAPSQNPTAAPVSASAIRSSSNEFQWGSIADGCDYQTPFAYLSCGGGGWITVMNAENAECEEMSLDYMKCKSLNVGMEDAFVDFKCTGYDPEHLTAYASIFGSEATNCDKVYNSVSDGATTTTTVGGSAVAFGTLGRFCMNDENEMELFSKYPCMEGMEGEDADEVTFCASGEVCTEEQTCGDFCNGNPTCDIALNGIEMRTPDQTWTCSEPDNTIGLPSDWTFVRSRMASFQNVEWTFSDQGFGCSWAVPELTATCQNGGDIRVDEEYPFCTVNGGSVVCSNPDPFSNENRISIILSIWCVGDSPDQLILAVNSPASNDPDSSCQTNGMAVQGISISRACGQFGSPEFQYVLDPAYCDDASQLHEGTGMCFGGDACPPPNNLCSPVVPSVTAGTANVPAVQDCVYAVAG